MKQNMEPYLGNMEHIRTPNQRRYTVEDNGHECFNQFFLIKSSKITYYMIQNAIISFIVWAFPDLMSKIILFWEKATFTKGESFHRL